MWVSEGVRQRLGMAFAVKGVSPDRGGLMTRPISRHPGAYYHIVRRTHRREYRLAPNEGLNGAVACLVQDACERTGVEVIAMAVMGNHQHVVVYDPYGRVSSWMTHVHGSLARYINAVQGTKSHVWDAQELKVQRLGDVQTVARVAAYVICNPVAAGQVRSPSSWPGICTRLRDVATGRGPVHARPKAFFRERGAVCEEGMVSHQCPPGVEPEVFRAMVGKALKSMLATARAKVKGSSRRYVGVRAVRRLNPFDSPRTESLSSAGGEAVSIRRQLASTTQRMLAMVEGERQFVASHRAARGALSQGKRLDLVVFPAGTWHQWRYYGARRRPMLTKAFAVP